MYLAHCKMKIYYPKASFHVYNLKRFDHIICFYVKKKNVFIMNFKLRCLCRTYKVILEVILSHENTLGMPVMAVFKVTFKPLPQRTGVIFAFAINTDHSQVTSYNYFLVFFLIMVCTIQ